MPPRVVITGMGMVTPLGEEPRAVLRRIEAGESAAAPPTGFNAAPFACPVCAQVRDFQPQRHVTETKMLRLMNRDAQLAVAAAHLAMADAQLKPGRDYAPEDIALFGATGLAGLPLEEVAPLIRRSVGPDGRFDPRCFGSDGLRSISPLLSFKVLGNMPVCFVSICENIQGPNCIYTPWEAQGAQAIEAGLRAIERGEARCALVGGCDVKTHELAFISLEQLGLFRSWRETGRGPVPAEGAVFLVLEREDGARDRGARAYARLQGTAIYVCESDAEPVGLGENVPPVAGPVSGIVGSLETGPVSAAGAQGTSTAFLLPGASVIHPKPFVGNLYAAAAALQVALGALLAEQRGGLVLAACLWHGREHMGFFVEKS